MLNISRTNRITYKINLRCLPDLLTYGVIKAVSQEFNSSSCSEIGTADTDYKQYLGITLDLLCSLFDSGKLFLIIVNRKIDPA